MRLLFFSSTSNLCKPLIQIDKAILLLAALLLISPAALYAQGVRFAGTTPSVDFGTVNLCGAGKTAPAPCSKVLTLTYNVTASGTLGAIEVVTEGTPDLDFTLAAGSSCTGAVTAGTTCTVNVNFVPKQAGARQGGVLIPNTSGKILAVTQIYGSAAGGPQIGFSPGAQVALPSTPENSVLLDVDSVGDLFFLEYHSGPNGAENNLLVKVPAGGGAPVTVFTSNTDTSLQPIQSMAVDGAGDIFVSVGLVASYYQTIVFEVPAGGGTPVKLPFSPYITGATLSVDGTGNLFAADSYNNLYELPVGSDTVKDLPFDNNSSTSVDFAANAAGDLFVSERGPYDPVETSPRVIELPAGGGAQFQLPFTSADSMSISVDGLGNLYATVVAPSASTTSILELSPGASTPIAAAGFASLNFFLVDQPGNFYIQSEYGGSFYKVQRAQSPPLNFPSTPIGATSTQPLTIMNTGTGSLTIAPSFSSDTYRIVSMTPANCVAGIPAAQTCTLAIGFSPPSDGSLNGTLTLATDTSNNPVVPLIATASGVVTPVFSLASGIYATAQSISITDPQPGAVIYYTTNGTLPTASSTPYTGPISVTSTERVTAIAVAAGIASPVSTASYTIVSAVPANVINFGGGFSDPQPTLQFNGSTGLDGSRLQLTNGLEEQASAFRAAPVNIQSFTTFFTFQFTDAAADGFTFTIQNVGDHALGGIGGYLGYQGIGKSVAIKFDLFNNGGEGVNSTGLYLDGAAPIIPAINLTGSGIDLHSGHAILAQLTYNGTDLILTLTDTVTFATWFHAFAVNIPAIVGGDTAFVGFTAGTGGLSADQEILSWTYTSGAPAPPLLPRLPQYAKGFTGLGVTTNGSSSTAGTALQVTNSGTFEANSAFFTDPINVQTFTTDFTFLLSSPDSSTPLADIADGFTFTIQNAGLHAVGGFGGALGYGGIGKSVAIKFDLHNNAGEGPNSTGFYLDGAEPTLPSIDLHDTPTDIHGDTMHAHITYDGTNLILTLTDVVNGGVAGPYSFPVNIPETVGGNTAYVGFTGATGASTAIQDVLNWTFSNP